MKDALFYDIIGQIEYKVNPRWGFMARYELTKYNYRHLASSMNNDNPHNIFATLKTSYMLTSSSTLHLGYQFGEVNWLWPVHYNALQCLPSGRNCCNPFNGAKTINSYGIGSVFKGGLLFAHLIYKF